MISTCSIYNIYSIYSIYRMYITCFKPKFSLIFFRYYLLFRCFFSRCLIQNEFFKKLYQLPSGYLSKINNRNVRIRREISSKLRVKTPERRHFHEGMTKHSLTSFWCLYCHYCNFKQISYFVLVFLSLNLNR